MRAVAVTAALASVAALVAAAPGASADPVDPQPRIVNGVLVNPANFVADWGFIVSLRINIPGDGNFRCGGTLVTDEVVITAAHCMFGRPPAHTQAQPAGITVLGGSTVVGAGFTSGVSELVIHPGYSPDGDIYNDLALLRLAAPVPAPAVATLAAPGDVPQSGAANVAGWGVNTCIPGDCSTTDDNLREASTPIQSAGSCNEFVGAPGFFNPSTQVCAGSFAEPPGPSAPDSCFGDSGGPLVLRDGGTRLVGVVSFGTNPVCGYEVAGYTGVGGFRCYMDPIIAGWDPAGFPLPTECTSVGTFVPMAPQRVIDTRPGLPLAPGNELAVPIVGVAGVPSAGVDAVSLNVTAVDPQAAGYLTVFPCGQAAPLASNVNYVAGGTVANSVAVGVGGNGAVCVTSFANTDVIIDVSGYWIGEGVTTSGSRYNPIAPVRLADTREAPTPLFPDEEGVLTVSSITPEAIGGVTLNVTVVDPAEDGFVTAYPCDSPVPNTSNVNYKAGQTVANAVTVAVSGAEQVCFITYATTDLIIDATGWFGHAGGNSGGVFSPVAPARLIDTRATDIVGAGGTLPVQAAGAQGVPVNATAVVVNVTATGPLADGYLSAFPCGQPLPATSTVNYLRGESVPNLAFVPVAADGTICINSFAASHVIVDVTGYFVP